MTRMFDTLVFDAKADVRYTGDGYMTAFPRVARTGIQLYYGSELGLKGQDAKKVMKVYRSPEQVFHKDAMTSFAHRPFTDDHPPVQVTAENWKQYATGQSGAEVARDGEFIRVPMVLMDAAAIKKFKDGKVEISMGYDCEIDFTPGTTPAGEAYDAVQKNPRGNHYAVVDAARGGSKLRIGDAAGKVNASAYADGLRAIMDGKVDRGDYASFADGTISGYLADKEYPFILKDGKVSLAALRGIKVDAIVKGDADVLTAVDTMLSQIDGTTTSAVNDGQQESLTMKVITIDGVPCQVDNDQTAAVIQRALDTSATALKTSQDAFGGEEEELRLGCEAHHGDRDQGCGDRDSEEAGRGCDPDPREARCAREGSGRDRRQGPRDPRRQAGRGRQDRHRDYGSGRDGQARRYGEGLERRPDQDQLRHPDRRHQAGRPGDVGRSRHGALVLRPRSRCGQHREADHRPRPQAVGSVEGPDRSGLVLLEHE
jgi:hypothetical protein